MTDTEYQVLQAQVIGAVQAVQILRERAPAIAKQVWGRWALYATPNELSAQSRTLVEEIVGELLHRERSRGAPSTRTLRLIVRRRER